MSAWILQRALNNKSKEFIAIINKFDNEKQSFVLAEFHDFSDIRYLLSHLNIETYQQACNIIAKYYPLQRFPQKTLYALEETLEKG